METMVQSCHLKAHNKANRPSQLYLMGIDHRKEIDLYSWSMDHHNTGTGIGNMKYWPSGLDLYMLAISSR